MLRRTFKCGAAEPRDRGMQVRGEECILVHYGVGDAPERCVRAREETALAVSHDVGGVSSLSSSFSLLSLCECAHAYTYARALASRRLKPRAACNTGAYQHKADRSSRMLSVAPSRDCPVSNRFSLGPRGGLTYAEKKD